MKVIEGFYDDQISGIHFTDGGSVRKGRLIRKFQSNDSFADGYDPTSGRMIDLDKCKIVQVDYWCFLLLVTTCSHYIYNVTLFLQRVSKSSNKRSQNGVVEPRTVKKVGVRFSIIFNISGDISSVFCLFLRVLQNNCRLPKSTSGATCQIEYGRDWERDR